MRHTLRACVRCHIRAAPVRKRCGIIRGKPLPHGRGSVFTFRPASHTRSDTVADRHVLRRCRVVSRHKPHGQAAAAYPPSVSRTAIVTPIRPPPARVKRLQFLPENGIIVACRGFQNGCVEPNDRMRPAPPISTATVRERPAKTTMWHVIAHGGLAWEMK